LYTIENMCLQPTDVKGAMWANEYWRTRHGCAKGVGNTGLPAS